MSLVSALISLPVAIRLGRPYHRMTERIDRTGKALAQSTNSFSSEILQNQINRQCVRLASSLIVPAPPFLSLAASAVPIFLLAAIVGFIALPLLGFTAGKIIFPVAMYLCAFAINAAIARPTAIFFANRQAFDLCGAPWDFQPTKKWTAQYRGFRSSVAVVLIYMVRDINKTTKSRPLRILRYQRAWRKIVAHQERYYTTIKDRPSRKQPEIRKRARALARLRKGQAPVTAAT